MITIILDFAQNLAISVKVIKYVNVLLFNNSFLEMIQEESCKRLTKILHRAFARAHFKEFAAAVDLDLSAQVDKRKVGVDNTVRAALGDKVQQESQQKAKALMAGIFQAPKLQAAFKRGASKESAGNYSKNASSKIRTSSLKRSQSPKKENNSMLSMLSKNLGEASPGALQRGITNLSPIQDNYEDGMSEYDRKESQKVQELNSENSALKEKMAQLLNKKAAAVDENELIRQHTMKNQKKQSDVNILKTMLSKVIKQSTSKTPTQATNTAQNSFQAFQSLNAPTTTANDQNKNGDEQEQTMLEGLFEEEVTYMCFGDSILIQFAHKVFQTELVEYAEKQKKGQTEGASDDELLDPKVNAGRLKSKKMARLVENPVFTYKGIVYGDDVVSDALTVIPKKAQGSVKNAAAQFAHCLFTVEIFDRCGVQQKIDDQKKLIEKMGHDLELLRPLKNYLKISEIEKRIVKEEHALKLFEEELLVEKLGNKDAQKLYFGQKVKFGQNIMLRHEHSGKYLRIEPDLITKEKGRNIVRLDVPSLLSKLVFVPAHDTKELAQELGIYSTGLTKFNMTIGGFINLKDAFYILNRETDSMQYLNVDQTKVEKPDALAQDDGKGTSIELTAGANPTHLRAKMFLKSSNKKAKIKHQNNVQEDNYEPEQDINGRVVYSGDTIRIKSEDTGTYLQIKSGNSTGVRASLPKYPDFLQAQIKLIDSKKLDKDGASDPLLDQDNAEADKKNQDGVDESQNDEEKKKGGEGIKDAETVHVDSEKDNEQMAFSCWQIQKVKTFQGGPIIINGLYRLKHEATQKFLSVDSQTNTDLKLVDASSIGSTNTLFCIRSITQEQENNADFNINEGSLVRTKVKIFISTFLDTYLQTIQSTNSDYQQLFAYKPSFRHNFYSQLQSKSQIGVIAAQRQLSYDEGLPQMVFSIELVNKKEARDSFHALGLTNAIQEYYAFLNEWAICPIDGNDVGLKATGHEFFLSSQEAIKHEIELQDKTRLMLEIIGKVKEMLSGKDLLGRHAQKQIRTLQRQFSEFRMVEFLAWTLELIYYKTMPPELREPAFLPDSQRTIKDPHAISQEKDEHIAFVIARENLDPLNSLILETLLALVWNCQENCERLTQFPDLLKLQLQRGDPDLIIKIICHMYKTSEYIFNDRGSIIFNRQQIVNQNLPATFTNKHQLQNWINLIETVRMQRDKENITQQIRYFKVLTSFCLMKDSKRQNEGRLHTQLQILNRIIDYESATPLWFGGQRQANKLRRPYVYFARLKNESMERFLSMNPNLSSCFSQGGALDGIKKFDIIFDLSELSILERDQPGFVKPYIDYICAVLNLYAAICAGRNQLAIVALRDRIGLNLQMILTIAESFTKELLPINANLKVAFLKLTRTFILENYPYAWYDQSLRRIPLINVCFWTKIKGTDMSQTVYDWEKIKNSNERYPSTENLTNNEKRQAIRKLRDILQDYFEEGTREIAEFIYSAEDKRYTKEQLTPYLNDLINMLRVMVSIYKTNNADALFWRYSAALIVRILAANTSAQLIDKFKDNWVFSIVRQSSKIVGCAKKVSKILTLCFLLLDLMRGVRLSEQMVLFYQAFKDFYEEGLLSHIDFKKGKMEPKFKRLFQIFQFTAEANIKSRQQLLHIFNRNFNIHATPLNEIKEERLVAEQAKQQAIDSLLSEEQKALQKLKNQDVNRQKKINKKKEQMLQKQKQNESSINSPEIILDDLENKIDIRIQYGKEQEDSPTNLRDKSGNQNNHLAVGGDNDVSDTRQSQAHLLHESKDQFDFSYDSEREGLNGRDESQRIYEKGLNPNIDMMGYSPLNPVSVAERKKSIWRNELPIDEFLIFYSLSPDFDQDMIAEEALSLLDSETEQVWQILSEAIQTQILATEEDQRMYEELVAYRDRLQIICQSLAYEECYFLLYKVGKKDNQLKAMREVFIIAQNLTKKLQGDIDQGEHAKVGKVQAIMRQLGIADMLLNNFTKKLYFDSHTHGYAFQSIIDLLQVYCNKNAVIQQSLQKHIPYLVEFIRLDLNVWQLMSQTLTTARAQPLVQKFVQFMLEQVRDEHWFRSQVIKLLGVLSMHQTPLMKMILSHLADWPVFRHKLYMEKGNSSVKVDRIKELVRKIMVLNSRYSHVFKVLKIDPAIKNDNEMLLIHKQSISMLSMCAHQSAFGVRIIRRLVDLNQVLDSILAQAIPFTFKLHYLRLLFNGYLQKVPSIETIDINFPKLLLVMKHVVLNDLENYTSYFRGLLKFVSLNEEDNELTGQTMTPGEVYTYQQIGQDLEKISSEYLQIANAKKNYKQKLDEKDFMNSLSPLNQNKYFPLLDPSDKHEYWVYLCSHDESNNQYEGLILFIRDFYESIRDVPFRDYSDELISVTQKLLKTLYEMIDKLEKLRESYDESMIHMEHLYFAIDMAIQAIPVIVDPSDPNLQSNNNLDDINQFGGEGGQNAANEPERDDQGANEMNKLIGGNENEVDAGDHEFNAETEEKIMRLIRDFIISNNFTVRRIFGVQSLAADVQVTPYFMRRKIKHVCGIDVTYKEVTWLVKKIMKTSLKKVKMKQILGTDVGQPSHIRTRYMSQNLLTKIKRGRKTGTDKHGSVQVGREKQKFEMMFNFREFETLAKNQMMAAGYKQILKVREETYEGEPLVPKQDPYLGISVQNNLQHFLKLYHEFAVRFDKVDELNDIAVKIIGRFSKEFQQVIQIVRDQETTHDFSKIRELSAIKDQIGNLSRFLKVDMSKFGPQSPKNSNKIFVLKLFVKMLQSVEPEQVEWWIQGESESRRQILQDIMVAVGALEDAIACVTPQENEEIVMLAIAYVQQMIKGPNKQALEVIKSSLNHEIIGFRFLKCLEQRIVVFTDELIKYAREGDMRDEPVNQEGRLYDVNHMSKGRSLGETLSAVQEEPYIRRNNPMEQPILYPPYFSYEHKLAESKNDSSNDLNMIYALLLYISESDHSLADFFFEGTSQNPKNVNVGVTLVQQFLKVISEFKEDVFWRTSVVQNLCKVLHLLTTLVEAEKALGSDFQILLAHWDQFQKEINWVLELDMELFQVDSSFSRSKLWLFSYTVKLFACLVSNPDQDLAKNVCLLMIRHINKENLRNKMVDIFKFRLGGTPALATIFKTERMCEHFSSDRYGCQKNMICSAFNLLPMDLLLIDTTHDLFLVVQTFNELLPLEETQAIYFEEQSVESRPFEEYSKFEYQQRMHFEAFNNLTDQQIRLRAVLQEFADRESGKVSIERYAKTLEKMYIHYAVHKHMKDFSVDPLAEMEAAQRGEERTEKILNDGIDQQDRILVRERVRDTTGDAKTLDELDLITQNLKSNNPYLERELNEIEWEEIFLEIKNGTKHKAGFLGNKIDLLCCKQANKQDTRLKRTLKLLCCFSWAYKFSEHAKGGSRREQVRSLLQFKVKSRSEKDLLRIQQFFEGRKLLVQKLRQTSGSYFGQYTQQILHRNIYHFETFKFDLACRFLQVQRRKIKLIDEEGNLYEENFAVQQYVHFISEETLAEIDQICEQDQLLDMVVLARSEMRWRQSLQRKMPLLMALFSKYKYMRKAAFSATFFTLLTLIVSNVLKSSFQEIYSIKADERQAQPKYVVFVKQYVQIMIKMQCIFNLTMIFLAKMFGLILNYPMHKQRVAFSELKTFGNFLVPSGRRLNTTAVVEDYPAMQGQPMGGTLLSFGPALTEQEVEPSQMIPYFKDLIQIVKFLYKAPSYDERQRNLKILLYFTILTTFVIFYFDDNLEESETENRSFLQSKAKELAIIILIFLHSFFQMPVFNQILSNLVSFWKQIAQILASCFIIFMAASLVKLLIMSKPAYQIDILTEEPIAPDKRNLQYLETVNVEYTIYDTMRETLADLLYPKVDIHNSETPLASMAGFLVLCFAIFFAGILFGLFMKEGKKGKEKSAQKCPICGLMKTELGQNEQAWKRHREQDHNVLSYIIYIMRVTDGNPLIQERLTLKQKSNREQIQKRDLSFLPTKSHT